MSGRLLLLSLASLAQEPFLTTGFLQKAPRVVSIADLHGDFERAVDILAHARLIDRETRRWIGGDSILVQTGDIIDRGDHGRDIYFLFFNITQEAKREGGTVINLLGNHEVMTFQEDLRYVTQQDYADFGGPEARLKAWSPSGFFGSQVRKWPVVAKVAGVLFSHAGPLPGVLRHKDTHGSAKTLSEVNKDMHDAVQDKASPEDPVQDALVGLEGPTWTRFWYEHDEAEVCPVVGAVLRAAGAHRMVVGHDCQTDFRVHAICEGAFVFADTCISRAYGGELSYVEYDNHGDATVVYPRLGAREALPRPPGPGPALREEVEMLQLWRAAPAPGAPEL